MILGVAEHHWLAENISVERLKRIKAIKLPRGSRKSAGRYISFQDLDAILAIANTHPNSLRRLRDLSIFTLMYDSGLRRSEIVSLSLADINWTECCFNIIGKGNKERNVYFDPASEMIEKSGHGCWCVTASLLKTPTWRGNRCSAVFQNLRFRLVKRSVLRRLTISVSG